jgi:murein DD-endopeptidase MepM/ murein hydrolase activator NlpD
MELQQVNGITDPKKVMPGTTIKIPAGNVAVAEVQPSAGELAPTAAAPVVAAPVAARAMQQPAQPTIINGGTQTAEVKDTPPAAPGVMTGTGKGDKIAVATPQAATQATSSTKLRWPANGKIIAGFGGRPDGTHNDGINLSVPLGTEVHSAENGVVAYAGSELKGYGNLVLVRHDNGWVTAYAHNDEMLVKRGDKVKRGQVIAKAGKTGTVDQPQVHFELRQGSKPVDPTPFMEKL